MTFLCDTSRNRLDVKVVQKDVGATKNNFQQFESFLEFLKIERSRALQEQEKIQKKRKELQEMQKEYLKLMSAQSQSDFLIKRKIIKSKIVDLERSLNGTQFTVEDFDRNVLPFLDMYYKRKENNLTDKDLSELYKNELFPQSSSPDINTMDTDNCTSCNAELICSVDDAMMYCTKCGNTKQYMDATVSNIAYGDEIEYASFSYKRINHLNEFLNHFQAKETSPVPDSVIQSIMSQLYEKRIRDPTSITFVQIKKAQKDLGLRKYYDQTMQIWCKITGKQPLRLDPVVEEKLRLLFIQIQVPFKKHCPNGRKNFLSYPYCMYKFCQMLSYHNLLPYLSLLKGKEKLQLQEEIFKKICTELGWKFIPI
jgi:hypothetical protein